MRILVTGGAGQLGRSLARRAAVTAREVVTVERAELDICDPAAIERALVAVAPAVVINAAAYTSVDRAESERERAFAVNATGAGAVARACAARGIAMVHVSTDHVFDGEAAVPYAEDAPRAPRNTYGASKAAGEDEVRAAGGAVVRTSWLFAAGGHGFVQAIVAAARADRVLRVVADQHGCPTFVDDLADALLELAPRAERATVYHYAGEGAVSRLELARAIVAAAGQHASLACSRVDGIASADRGAARPRAAVLGTARVRALGICPRSWRPGLAQVVIAALAEHGAQG